MTAQEYDVVVVGSGGAGMVAALTAAHRGLSTLVIEKAAHFGGSTARSGGGVWIPNNEVLRRDGVKDTAEAARTYLHGIIGEIGEPERIDTYLERGPEMLSFVLKNTPLKMCWVPRYSDYYPEAPGGRAEGRSIEPKPFNARKLGADEAGLEPAYGKVPLNVVVMQQDYVRLNMLKRHPRGVLRSLKVGARTMWAKATGKNLVGMGRALIAPLRIGLQRAGVPVVLNTALTDLYVEDGVVREEMPLTIREAKPRDVPDIQAVTQEAYAGRQAAEPPYAALSESEDDVRKHLEAGGALVAVTVDMDGEHIVGAIRYREDAPGRLLGYRLAAVLFVLGGWMLLSWIFYSPRLELMPTPWRVATRPVRYSSRGSSRRR